MLPARPASGNRCRSTTIAWRSAPAPPGRGSPGDRSAPEERERSLLAALPGQIAHAKGNAPGWARILSGIDPGAVTDRTALAKLPVTRKSDLPALQKAERPFGGLNAVPVARMGRVFVSPGPIYDPGGTGRDWWRTARALFA